MRSALIRHLGAAIAASAILVGGCTGSGSDYESPILSEEPAVTDIANLPDIDQTRAQMLDLIERVRAEVSRLVPASAPWRWNREESRGGCRQDETNSKGVRVYFANLVSQKSFTDAEWSVAFPAVQKLAADAGLTNSSAMQDSTGAHDVRFTSDDGRVLRFGSIEASLITGSITCRRSAP